MTKDEVKGYALSLENTVCDMPFSEDFETTVLRHSDSKKWFGLLFSAPAEKVGAGSDGEVEILNLKCDPMLSYGLCEKYRGIVPAYHMNKYHWISVVLQSDVTDDDIKSLISLSYHLTEGKK